MGKLCLLVPGVSLPSRCSLQRSSPGCKCMLRWDLFKSSQITKKPSTWFFHSQLSFSHLSFLFIMFLYWVCTVKSASLTPLLGKSLCGQKCKKKGWVSQCEGYTRKIKMGDHTSEAWHSFRAGAAALWGCKSLLQQPHAWMLKPAKQGLGMEGPLGGPPIGKTWYHPISSVLPPHFLPSALPISSITTTTTTPQPCLPELSPFFDLHP